MEKRMPYLPLEKEAHPLINAHETLQHILSEITEIMDEHDPNDWFFFILLYLKEIKEELKARKASLEVKEFLDNYLNKALTIIKKQVEKEPLSEDLSKEDKEKIHAEAAVSLVHDISLLFDDVLPAKSAEKLDFSIEQISIDTIVEQLDHEGYQARIIKEPVSNNEFVKDLSILQIYSPKQKKWFDFPLPTDNHIWHKGGFPRVLLKLHAKAPVNTIEAELPPNDFDILTTLELPVALKHADVMGVDQEGVEHMSTYDTDLIFSTRDLTLNTCIVSKNDLIFSTHALHSAKTGEITQVAEERGLYGSDALFFQGEKLAKNRGMFRLIKFVCEEKALSFKFKPLNKQVDLGLYFLVLARKFEKKDNKDLLFSRFFDIAKQMGQVKEHENDIFDVLNRVHEEYKFFDFGDKTLDEKGVAKWMTKKLISSI